MITSDDYYQW